MTDGVRINADEVLRTLDKLGDEVAVRLAQSAMRAAAKETLASAVRKIQSLESSEATRTMEKSLQVFKMKPLNGRIRYGVRIKPKSFHLTKRDGKGLPVRVGLYAAVLEYGGKKRNQPAWAWLRNGGKESADAALNAATSAFKKGFDRAVKKAAGK